MRDTVERYMLEALHLKDLGVDLPNLPQSDPLKKKKEFDAKKARL